MNPTYRQLLLPVLLSLAVVGTPTAAATQGPPESPGLHRSRDLTALDEACRVLAAGKAELAEQILTALVGRSPDLETGWYQLALARFAQGKAEAALAAVDTALAKKANFPEARILWIELSIEREPDRCRDFVRDLLKHDDVATMRRPLLPHMIALQMLEEAEDVLKVLRAEAPRDVELLKLQARLQIDNGKPKEASTSIEELLVIEPRDPFSLTTLAKLYEITGETEKVLPTYERLVAVNPSNVAARQRVIEMLAAQDAASPKLEEHRRLLRYYQRNGNAGKGAGPAPAGEKAPPASPPKGGR